MHTTLEERHINIEQSGMKQPSRPPPCVIVIFGASGDLAHRELIPALFSLFCKNLLPERFAIVGFAISQWSDDAFREEMRKAVRTHAECKEEKWDSFGQRVFYVPGNFEDTSMESYERLQEKVRQVRQELSIDNNILFHLATLQRFYGKILNSLGPAGLTGTGNGWRRVILEKPFGRDEASARKLDAEILESFREEQIFRVDHFLGKETVQNMLVFRFANPGFEPIWNRNYIDNIQITVAEDFGIRERGKFYEETGVLRDMVQNHLLQLLCIATIEPPVNYDKSSLRNETVKVLESITPITHIEHDCVLGQYGAGEIGDRTVRKYREEDNVRSDSTTPTYAALKLMIDNWRWAGVPMYLRTGKRLARKLTEVTVQFKATPHSMFPDGQKNSNNLLTFRLQPDEGILYGLMAKRPGAELQLTPVNLDFSYASVFGIDEPPSAYEWLLYDAMHGDETLFPRADWIYRAWSLIDPIVKRWETEPWLTVPNYIAGSWGPTEGDLLIKADGKRWRVS